MKVTHREFGSGITVLSNEHFVSIPYKVDFTAITDVADNGLKVIKAGTAMAANGVKAAVSEGKSNAIGILMHDVYESNPNTALIIHGFIDKAKAEKNTGVTYENETMAALPMIQLL